MKEKEFLSLGTFITGRTKGELWNLVRKSRNLEGRIQKKLRFSVGGATSRPRNSRDVGTGGPTGAIPHSRSRGAVVRRYPSPKVRSSGCTLLEQP